MLIARERRAIDDPTREHGNVDRYEQLRGQALWGAGTSLRELLPTRRHRSSRGTRPRAPDRALHLLRDAETRRLHAASIRAAGTGLDLGGDGNQADRVLRRNL